MPTTCSLDDAPSDSGRGTFTGTGTSKSRTSEVCDQKKTLLAQAIVLLAK